MDAAHFGAGAGDAKISAAQKSQRADGEKRW